MRAVPNRSKQVQCPAVSGNCFFPLIILNYGFGIVFFFLGCMPSFESLALSNRHVVALLVLVCLRDLSTARKKTQNNTDFYPSTTSCLSLPLLSSHGGQQNLVCDCWFRPCEDPGGTWYGLHALVVLPSDVPYVSLLCCCPLERRWSAAGRFLLQELTFLERSRKPQANMSHF